MVYLKPFPKLKFAFAAVITLISLNFWSFQFSGKVNYSPLEALACLALLVVIVYNLNVFTRKGLHFKSIVSLFILIPLLSVMGANLFHDQPMHLSLLLLRLNLFWLFYFVLHVLNIPTEKIIKFIIFVGCIWAFITTIQQFTYPVYFFYIRDDASASLVRSDVFRFLLEGREFGVFVLVYCFQKFLNTNNRNQLLFVALALAAFYFYGTRQVAAAAIGCLLIVLLYHKGVSKWGYLLFFGSAAAMLILIFQPPLIMHYIDTTADQVDNDDYIRFLSADFYLNEYWPHWSTKLLGNGKAHELSSYGEEMEYINHVLRFWRADVGIIGSYNQYGLFYVLLVFGVTIKGIFLKFRNPDNTYLKIIFYNAAFLVILNERYSNSAAIPFYCLIFYLIDKTYEEEKNEKLVLQPKKVEKPVKHADFI